MIFAADLVKFNLSGLAFNLAFGKCVRDYPTDSAPYSVLGRKVRLYRVQARVLDSILLLYRGKEEAGQLFPAHPHEE